MTSKTITFNADEQITNRFERACADMGITLSDAIIALMKTALQERSLLFETVERIDTESDFQRQWRQAAEAFIASDREDENELTAEDYAEFESGKYKPTFNFRMFKL